MRAGTNERVRAARHLCDDLLLDLQALLLPYIETQLQSRNRGGWESVLEEHASSHGQEHRLHDPKYLLWVLGRERNFPSSPALRDALERLRAIRRSWAHFELDVPAASSAIDAAERLVDGLGIRTAEADARLAAHRRAIEAVVAGQHSPELATLRRAYLSQLLSETALLPLGWTRDLFGSLAPEARFEPAFLQPTLETVTGPSGDERSLPLRGPAPRQVSLSDLAYEGDRLVILGGVGAGKSTLLRGLARLTALAQGPYVGRSPLLTSAPDLLAAVGLDPGIPIETAVRTRLGGSFGAFLGYELELGRLLLLVDGLDEIVDDADRTRLISEIERFSAANPHAVIVVSSRETAYRDLGGNFRALRLQPLDDETSDRLTTSLIEALSPADGDGPSAFRSVVHDAGVSDDLRGNPLMLTLLVLLWSRSALLPRRRHQVLGSAARLLLGTWPKARDHGEHADAYDEYLEVLGPIAFDLVATGRSAVPRSELRAKLRQRFIDLGESDRSSAGRRASRLTERIRVRTGLLVEQPHVGEDPPVTFAHRSLMEHLAAHHLVERWREDRESVFPLLPQPRWWPVLELAFGTISDEGLAAADMVVDSLLVRTGAVEEAAIPSLRLASRLVASGTVTPSDPCLGRLGRRLAEAFIEPSKAPFADEVLSGLQRHVAMNRADAPSWLPISDGPCQAVFELLTSSPGSAAGDKALLSVLLAGSRGQLDFALPAVTRIVSEACESWAAEEARTVPKRPGDWRPGIEVVWTSGVTPDVPGLVSRARGLRLPEFPFEAAASDPEAFVRSLPAIVDRTSAPSADWSAISIPIAEDPRFHAIIGLDDGGWFAPLASEVAARGDGTPTAIVDFIRERDEQHGSLEEYLSLVVHGPWALKDAALESLGWMLERARFDETEWADALRRVRSVVWSQPPEVRALLLHHMAGPGWFGVNVEAPEFVTDLVDLGLRDPSPDVVAISEIVLATADPYARRLFLPEVIEWPTLATAASLGTVGRLRAALLKPGPGLLGHIEAAISAASLPPPRGHYRGGWEANAEVEAWARRAAGTPEFERWALFLLARLTRRASASDAIRRGLRSEDPLTRWLAAMALQSVDCGEITWLADAIEHCFYERHEDALEALTRVVDRALPDTPARGKLAEHCAELVGIDDLPSLARLTGEILLPPSWAMEERRSVSA